MTKISDAGLVTSVNDSQKMPTGEPGDKAISVGQIKTHVKSDLSKSDVGLSNVDNTSDVDKPVSTLQAAADLAAENNAKAYADNLVQGLKWKPPVDVATTANITLSGEQTIDGIATDESRVLVKDQNDETENGIYVSASGAWSRATDANTNTSLEGATVTVQRGTANEDTTWSQTADGITIGTTDIVFAQLGATVPDWSDTVKGKVERAIKTEAETAADTTEGNRDNDRGLTARSWRWAFDAVWTWIKTQAQTFTAAITATDFTATNQSGTGYKIAILDSAGKIVRYANGTVDPTTGAITLAGVDDLAASHTLAVVNQTGNVIAKFYNDQRVEFGGTTSFWKILSSIGSGLAGIILNTNHAVGFYISDGLSTLMRFRTTTGDKAAVFTMKYEQDSSLGFVTQVRQYSESVTGTAATPYLIAAIPIASGQHFEVTVLSAKAKTAGNKLISCNVFKSMGFNNAGTLSGVTETITMLRQTATTGGWSVVFNDTDDQWELWYTAEIGVTSAADCDVQLSISIR